MRGVREGRRRKRGEGTLACPNVGLSSTVRRRSRKLLAPVSVASGGAWASGCARSLGCKSALSSRGGGGRGGWLGAVAASRASEEDPPKGLWATVPGCSPPCEVTWRRPEVKVSERPKGHPTFERTTNTENALKSTPGCEPWLRQSTVGCCIARKRGRRAQPRHWHDGARSFEELSEALHTAAKAAVALHQRSQPERELRAHAVEGESLVSQEHRPKVRLVSYDSADGLVHRTHGGLGVPAAANS